MHTLYCTSLSSSNVRKCFVSAGGLHYCQLPNLAVMEDIGPWLFET